MTGTVKNNVAAEEWRDIKGYEGLYQVSSLGRVKGLERIINGQTIKERFLACSKNSQGYAVACLSNHGLRKYCKVHRLVAMMFIPNPNNLPQINHKDEIRDNNHVDNLEWCDCKYNLEYRNGQKRRGDTNRGKKRSTEICQKFSEAQKKYHQNHPEEGLRQSERLKEYYRRNPHVRKTMNLHKMKPIVQLDRNGNFVRFWDAGSIAAKELNACFSNINSCCRGLVKTAYGFKWKYKSDYEKDLDK